MIGGEFPISVTDILNAENRQLVFPDVYAYSSGRAALFQVLKFLRQEKGVSCILLPDYLCSSIFVPINALGLEYSFYPIDERYGHNDMESIIAILKENLNEIKIQGLHSNSSTF